MSIVLDGTNGITSPVLTGALTGSTGLPKAALPTGSVLQVVSASGVSNLTTSSSTFVDTGMTATITPTSATSKILVLSTINGAGKASGNAGSALALRLVRGSTTILNIEGLLGYTGASTNNYNASGTTYVDSPATTSATVYKIQFANPANAVAVYINNYYVSPSETNSTITLMEIAG